MKRSKQEQDFVNKLGKRIATLRKSKGVTQEKLAQETNLDRVAIAYIETGKRNPTATSLNKIAKALNIKLTDIFKDL